MPVAYALCLVVVMKVVHINHHPYRRIRVHRTVGAIVPVLPLQCGGPLSELRRRTILAFHMEYRINMVFHVLEIFPFGNLSAADDQVSPAALMLPASNMSAVRRD